MRPIHLRKLASLLGAVLLASTAPIHVWAQGKPAEKWTDKPIHSTGKTHSSAAGKARAKSTLKKTKTSSRSSKKRRRERAQTAPTPDRIREIQAALEQNGMYEGQPSGKWDDNTAEAMKKFQTANGLKPTGKLDARTLQKLGLGSDVAGRAAPHLASPPGSSERQ